MQIESIDLPSILLRIRKNVGILLSATGLAMAIGFATVVLNARAIGAEGLGIIALFQASAAILTGLFNIASQQPMIRLGRRAIEDHRKDRVGIIAGLAVLVDNLAAALAGICALSLIWFAPGLIGLSDEMRSLALVYTIVIFLSGTAASNGILRLLNCFHYIGAIQVANAILIFLAALALFLNEAAVGAYVVAYALIHATTAITQIALALLLLRGSGIAVRFSPRAIRQAGILREYFSYAWTTSVTGTLDTIRRDADALLLGAFFGPAAVGIYSVIKQLAGVFNKLSNALYSSVFPEIAALESRSDYVGAAALRSRMVYFVLVAGAAFVLLAVFLGEVILRVGFGEHFAEGAAALALMLVAITVNFSAGIQSMFVQVFISPRRLLLVFVGAFAAYLLAAPAAIVALGLIGVPIGQIVFASGLWLGCWISLGSVLPRKVATTRP
jgi:O-antigen/teichoic acid export membrane protein